MKKLIPALFSFLVFSSLYALPCHADSPQTTPPLLTNPSFESSLSGWEPLWTRDPNTGTESIDTAVMHGGKASLQVHFTGEKDWSIAQTTRLPVHVGDIFTLSGWIKGEGAADAQLSVVTRGADGAEIDWMAGLEEVNGTHDWQQLSRRWVVPSGVATVQFRLTGAGPGTVWLDDLALVKDGNAAALSSKRHGQALQLTNAVLDVRLNEEDGTLAVTDKRGGIAWHQQPLGEGLIVKDARRLGPRNLELTVWDVASDLTLEAALTLDPAKPKLSVQISGTGTQQQAVDFPPPFVSGPGTWLVLPMNEGIIYPVDDASIPPITLTTYSGHGLCMPWFGAVDPTTGAGVQTILQTPDDAHVEFTRHLGGRLYAQPAWEPSRGAFSYPRVLTYVFSAKGGYVAQAKQYRAYARSIGLFKTLAEKQRSNPNVGLLLGAVNVWNWDMDKVALCREMKSLGMDHVLWSSGGTPQKVAQINALGYLSSRYDIFQDVWPADAPTWLHHDGWPEDLVKLPSGGMMLGWADREKKPEGTEVVYQGGIINSQRGLARARLTIPADLKTTPYRCRFIDTTTASPWREDYDPAHPLTRTQDRHYKMALLDFCANDMKQVVGTETGIDPSVPYADYYEGMMSLAQYRLPDAGYTMMAYQTPTPDFLKFQVGHFYRVPLWELVYHECVVANWYWGDSTNKAPEVWSRRDLFNLLYGTPPMFLFDRTIWEKNKAHFVQTYKTVCPIVRRLANAEMLTHEFLTPDHAVQRTRWSTGTTITVNFGTVPYHSPDGSNISPGGWQVR
ncbi:MAG: glycoside hydrolase [Janthinobacterium lividum]